MRLRDKIGSIVLEINYSSQPPWPEAADGTGHSIALVRPSYGENDPRAWTISDVVGGSPGVLEGYSPSPLRSIVINEFLAHTDSTNEDYIELYNHSTNLVDISGCILTDDVTTNKFVAPIGTLLPPRGFISFRESQLGFSLNAAGETIFLKNPSQTRILDAVTFEEQGNGISFGRFPDGAGEFYPLRAQTPGLPNSQMLIRDVVINEIMYDPISLDNNDQYVELYNKGTNTINLEGWKFTSGISFTFPANTLLGPDNYLVVGRSITNLLANYPNLNSGNTLGNFGGTLSHGGERLALSMPDLMIKTNNAGIWTTNTIFVVEDEVTYGTGGKWGQWAAGGGSSLELKDPASNHRQPSSWADSDESNKSSWTNIEATSILDNGSFFTGTTLSWLQIGLLQSGECLIDNVELISTTGANVIPNPSFDAGLTGWVPLGDHYRSSLEIGAGFGGSGNALHIRSSGQFWTGRNNVQTSLTTSPGNTGQTNTIRFKARWLKGWTEPIARVNGNWMEATGTMPVPKNLGTPGARNSRAATNAGPRFMKSCTRPRCQRQTSRW